MTKVSIVAVFALALGLAGAQAETFPSKPITVIVPFPAGGPTDTVARLMSDHMKNTLGQSLLVETVTGAGATIGVGRVVSAPPDGYTLGMGNIAANAINPALQPAQISYNPVKDFAAISRIGVTSLILVANVDKVPARSIHEFIDLLKAIPGHHDDGASGPSS